MLTCHLDRILISQKAMRYYNYQRCTTQKMTHQQAEEYAYQFHSKIFKQIQPYLKEASTAVDFGCGIGVINVFTSHYFKNVWLVDNTVPEADLNKTYYGFHGPGFDLQDDKADAPVFSENTASSYCFYNDLSLTRETLVNNQVKAHLECMTPDELFLKPIESVDLVQSHMSWGWHFPFSIYKNNMYPLLKPNGLLIADIRNNSLCLEDLVGFQVVDQLENREKNSLKYVLQKC